MNATYLLLTRDARFEQRARQLLGLANGQLERHDPGGDPGDAAVDHRAAGPDGRPFDVVVVGPGVDGEHLLQEAARLEHANPHASILLVVEQHLEPTDLHRALEVGVRGVVTPDTADEELEQLLRRAASAASRRRGSPGAGSPDDGHHARTIVLVSPKGGAGKTMLAVNLAAALATTPGTTAALVDLDIAFGDAASALGLVPEYTFASISDAPAVDNLALKVFLTPHPQTGLFTLCAPDDPADADRISPRLAAEVVRELATEFSHVVVDTPAGVSEHTLAVLESATDVLLVCTMDVASVRSLRKAVDALDELGHTTARRTFVLNRAPSRVGLSVEDIERTVGLPVSTTIPSHRTVPTTMNQGAPLVDTAVRSPVRSGLLEVRDRFVTEAAGRPSAWTATRRLLT